jgi:rhodanese-related sulfurtransferase
MNKVLVTILIAVILVVVLAFVVGNLNKGNEQTATSTPVASTKAVYKKISAAEAKTMIDSKESLIILDVRTAGEFADGHIENALNIANESIGSEKPSGLPELDAKILVYCRSGNRSAQAAKKLIAMGYTQVYDFGGLNTWTYGTVQ